MAPITITPIQLTDRVRLRKPHACGGHEWTIVRVGADIGLKCETCGRRVLLPRRDFERRLEHVIRSEKSSPAGRGLGEGLSSHNSEAAGRV